MPHDSSDIKLQCLQRLLARGLGLGGAGLDRGLGVHLELCLFDWAGLVVWLGLAVCRLGRVGCGTSGRRIISKLV